MSKDHAVPIIRFEIESMRVSVVQALTEYAVRRDADIKAAVEQAMTPEKLAQVIQRTVEVELAEAIKSEISSFYRFGGGRDIIKQAVLDTLARRADDDAPVGQKASGS